MAKIAEQVEKLEKENEELKLQLKEERNKAKQDLLTKYNRNILYFVDGYANIISKHNADIINSTAILDILNLNREFFKN